MCENKAFSSFNFHRKAKRILSGAKHKTTILYGLSLMPLISRQLAAYAEKQTASGLVSIERSSTVFIAEA